MGAANQTAIDLARAYLARFLVVHAERKRHAGNSAFGPSSDEVARTLAHDANGDVTAQLATEQSRVDDALAAFRAAIAREPSGLARLRRVFSLSELDVQIVAVLLAPELDHDLERALTFA